MPGIDLTSVWSTLYSTVNLPLLVILTGSAFVLHRLKMVTARLAVWGPVVFGGVIGMLDAIAKVTDYQGGYIKNAQLAESVLIGFAMYGLGSVLIGRGVSIALDKTGLLPADGAPPVPPAP